MPDPSELFELHAEPDLGSPPLILALDGFVDGGQAVRLARDHLLAAFASELVATFDLEELIDYRARRPFLVFDTDRWAAYAAPTLAVHALKDANGTTFLLLGGPEPDFRWEQFVEALLGLIERLGVRLTVGLHAVPWAAPHTRPMGLTTYGRPRELLRSPPAFVGRIQVPAALSQLVEYRLVEAGRDAIGLAAHVPYYLGQVEYPEAAEVLLGGVERTADLALGLEPLRAAAEAARTEVDAQLRDDEQATEVVRVLEERHDEFIRDGGWMADEVLPTGDELGAAFERFLDERSRRGRPEGPPGS